MSIQTRSRSTGALSARAFVLVPLLALAPITIITNIASAAVTSSFAAGVLVVTGDDSDDAIDVRCSDDGRVRVDRRAPETGRVECVDVIEIAISGGGGRDVIDVTRIDVSTFTGLMDVTLDGGGGNDRLEGTSLVDVMTGGDGDDALIAGIGDAIDGGADYDRAEIDGIEGALTVSPDTFPGIEKLHLSLSDTDDRIDARDFDGPLTANGRDGDDVIMGGSDRNRIAGGDGDDRLVGGSGDDSISGGSGLDVGIGKAGNDHFDAFSSRGERLLLGAGNDLVVFVEVSGGVDIRGGSGADHIVMRVNDSTRLTDDSLVTMNGRAALASIERATINVNLDLTIPTELDASGFSGTAALFGGYADDVLIGGSSGDTLDGFLGDDVLQGGAGHDRLDGGDGRDTCDGGPGPDRVINCERA
jgi:Ca2+-binding RTX toxin-like protein